MSFYQLRIHSLFYVWRVSLSPLLQTSGEFTVINYYYNFCLFPPVKVSSWYFYVILCTCTHFFFNAILSFGRYIGGHNFKSPWHVRHDRSQEHIGPGERWPGAPKNCSTPLRPGRGQRERTAANFHAQTIRPVHAWPSFGQGLQQAQLLRHNLFSEWTSLLNLLYKFLLRIFSSDLWK